MIHLHMFTEKGEYIEVDSYSSWNCHQEQEQAFEAAQQWADEYGEDVDVYHYEGHETLEDGEMLGVVKPQPLQLAIVGKPEVVTGQEQNNE